METKRTERITAELDSLEFGYWSEGDEEFVTDAASVQKELGLSDLAYDSILMFVDNLKEMVGKDLADIWERLEILDRKVYEDD